MTKKNWLGFFLSILVVSLFVRGTVDIGWMFLLAGLAGIALLMIHALTVWTAPKDVNLNLLPQKMKNAAAVTIPCFILGVVLMEQFYVDLKYVMLISALLGMIAVSIRIRRA